MKKNYPWLNIIYKQILTYYLKSNIKSSSILLCSPNGNGVKILCYTISRWLLCFKPNGMKNCNICCNCILMKNNNCPDFYKLESIPGSNNLGIDNIRFIIDSVCNTSHQGKTKVIFIFRSELMTEQASNALLKILEEPPKKTFFILSCQFLRYLLPTIKSRCLLWMVPVLNEFLGLQWLKNNYNYNTLDLYIALRSCGNILLSAKYVLSINFWEKRLILCETLYKALYFHNMLLLLPLLNNNYDDLSLQLFISFISDGIKWKLGLFKFLSNYDEIKLIKFISLSFKTEFLYIQWKNFSYYLYKKYEINNINDDLFLSYYLLSFEKYLNKIK